jgi:hypothetical protein
MTAQPTGYSLHTIGQAYTPAGVIPVSRGVAALNGDVAHVIALADNPYPFGKNDDGTPIYPAYADWLVDRFFPFLDNCQFRVDRLRNYAVPLVAPDTLRSLAGKGDAAHWLDDQPFRVLLAEGDRVVGVHFNASHYVLIVRQGVVMAGVRVETLPQGVRDAGYCDHDVIAFEQMMEADESLQADALQQAFNYAGRIHDRSTATGKVKAGELVEKLRPAVSYYERAARDRAVDAELKRRRS